MSCVNNSSWSTSGFLSDFSQLLYPPFTHHATLMPLNYIILIRARISPWLGINMLQVIFCWPRVSPTSRGWTDRFHDEVRISKADYPRSDATREELDAGRWWLINQKKQSCLTDLSLKFSLVSYISCFGAAEKTLSCWKKCSWTEMLKKCNLPLYLFRAENITPPLDQPRWNSNLLEYIIRRYDPHQQDRSPATLIESPSLISMQSYIVHVHLYELTPQKIELSRSLIVLRYWRCQKIQLHHWMSINGGIKSIWRI